MAVMRKIVVSEFVSLDGIFEDPGGAEGYKYGGWSHEFNTPESGKFKFDELLAGDALLLGRVTYEGFAKAWPNMEGTGEFGERMNSIPKYVVSTTLKETDLTWNNSHLIKDNLEEAVQKLKQEPGQNILVAGSGQLTCSLLKLGLIDEVCLMVYPVILGSGKRFFNDADKTELELLATKEFSNGTLVLTYQPTNLKK